MKQILVQQCIFHSCFSSLFTVWIGLSGISSSFHLPCDFFFRHRSSCDSYVCRTWSGPTARESAQSGSSRYETTLHHFTNCTGVPQNRREFSALVIVRNEGGEQLDWRDKGTATGGGGHSSSGEVEELLNHCILLWLVNNSTKTLGFFFRLETKKNPKRLECALNKRKTIIWIFQYILFKQCCCVSMPLYNFYTERLHYSSHGR